MAFSYDFKDNVVYGADDINAIRTSILTKGVVEESATSCMVSRDESTIKIAPGQAIFEDGCRIKVDEEGVCQEAVPGEKVYVYFYNNILAGICEVRVETSIPTGDFILLAEMDSDGNIADKRQFAQLKTADAERYAASFNSKVIIPQAVTAGEVIGRIELPKSNCSFVEINCLTSSSSAFLLHFFPKEGSNFTGRYPNGVFLEGEILTLSFLGTDYKVKFEFSGSTLICRSMNTVSGQFSGNEVRLVGYCVR